MITNLREVYPEAWRVLWMIELGSFEAISHELWTMPVYSYLLNRNYINYIGFREKDDLCVTEKGKKELFYELPKEDIS